MEKLLSVVVPAYNVEQYLQSCLDSLLQTEEREKTEILVVDDGSKDATWSIAENYQNKYPSIVRAIHKENGGHGSTINVGIKEAKGKFFRVLDSDDTVNSKAYDSYLKKLEQADCDLVATPFTCVWYKDETIVKEKIRQIEGASDLEEGKIYSFPEVAEKLFVRMHEWTIRTEILKEHQIALTEHSFYVDMQYVLFPVPWIKTVCMFTENVYRYRLGMEGQSVSVRNMQKNREQHKNVLCSLVDFYKSREEAGDKASMLAYLAGGIAKMQADEVQIALSMPIGKAAKKQLMAQERYLKENCLAAYEANQKKSITVLRLSKYLIYPVVAIAWRIIKK